MVNWDKYNYFPMGRILEELKRDGFPLTRDQFKALEKKGYWYSGRTVGGWRRYTPAEANIIKKIIKQAYYGIEEDDD